METTNDSNLQPSAKVAAPNIITSDSKLGDKIAGYWGSYKTNIIDRQLPYWTDYYQKYSSYLVTGGKARESNLFIPRCFDSVETAVPRLLLALFSVKPPFQMIGRGNSDIKQAEDMATVYNYYNDRTNLFGFLNNAIKSTAIYGTEIIKSGWDKTTNMPVRWIVGVQNYFQDPAALIIEEAEYTGDRRVRSYQYLKNIEKMGIYSNIDKVLKSGKRYTPGGNDLTTNTKSTHGFRNPYELTQDKENPQFEVIECYIENGKRIVTIAGGITIRDTENPFPSQDNPYCPIVLTPDPAEFYGIGLIQPIKNLQEEINDWNNAAMDYMARTINPILKVPISELENSASWSWKCGAKWKVNGQGSTIEQLDMRPLPAEVFSYISSLNANLDRTLALSDYVRGTGGGGESATGAAILAQAADTRLKLQLYTIQNCLKRLVKFELKNMQEFLPADFVIRITEKPYVKTMSIKDIQGEFDVTAAGISDLSTKESKRSQLTNLLNVLISSGIGQIMAVEGKRLMFTDLLKQILETFEMKNMDSVIQDLPKSQPILNPASDMMGGGNSLPNNLEEVLKSTAESTAPNQQLPVAPGIGGLR